MSTTSALGAFAQGLVSGYKAGDDMKTAESRRKYIDQQTALDEQKTIAAKRALEEQQKLDGLKNDLAASIGDMFKTTTMPAEPAQGGAIAMPATAGQPASGQPTQALSTPGGLPKVDPDAFSRYSEKLMTYLTHVDPAKADEFRRTRKAEAIADQGRQIAETTAGLLSGDPAYIPKAAAIFRQVDNGIDIEPTQSKFLPNGNLQLTLYDTKTGEMRGTKEFTRDQILVAGMRGAASIADFNTMYGQMETRRETGRHNVKTEENDAERNRLHAAGNAEARALRRDQNNARAEDRADAAKRDWLKAAYDDIFAGYKSDFDELKSPKYEASETARAERDRALRTSMSLAQSVVADNLETGKRIAPATARLAAEDVLSGRVKLVPAKDKEGNIDRTYAWHPEGFLMRIPRVGAQPK